MVLREIVARRTGDEVGPERWEEAVQQALKVKCVAHDDQEWMSAQEFGIAVVLWKQVFEYSGEFGFLFHGSAAATDATLDPCFAAEAWKPVLKRANSFD